MMLTRKILMIFLLFNYNHVYAANMNITQHTNDKLHNQLPAHILSSKQLIVVNDGHVPPYIIDEKNTLTGASIDLLNAMSEILGITVKHERVGSVSSMLMGVNSGRYDLSMGPVGDNPERQKSNDFIAYAASYYAFIVKKGNPTKIYSNNDLCGRKIAIPAAGGSEERLKIFSENCRKENKSAIDIMAFKDQPSAFLAVKSGQADAFYGGISILSHYVANAKDDLELAVTQASGSMPERYYSAFVAKDSPLGPVLFAALQELFNNGTYHSIMKKWGLETSELNAPGMNLAK